MNKPRLGGITIAPATRPEPSVVVAQEEAKRVGPVAAPAPRPARARNWRCPNPRDCGDPTCDGSCGY